MGEVGFVGVGKMGSRMANRLIDAGHSVTVWNRPDMFFEENVAPLKKKGAKLAASPLECGQGKDVCFTSVADGPALEQVCLGPDGILKAQPVPGIIIDMGTVGPWESDKIAAAADAAGAGFLRSPVSGSTVLAEAGKLTIIASGDKAVFDAADPYLAALGEVRHYVGPGENARYLKLIFNLNIFAQMQILAESAVFGEKGGLDWEQMLEIVTTSVAASPFIKYKVPPLQKRDYSPTFTLNMVLKDVRLALEAARRAGVDMPFTKQLLNLEEQAVGEGLADLDVAAVALWYEKKAGLDYRVS
jgi:3-hydroxyisobutyrate dehydrogenase-like beta-hydroxyacid dehydrogenase